MMVRKFNYTAEDGNHWPDANVGDDLYYAVDISCWLEDEADTLISTTWTVPVGLTSSDEYTEATSAVIKLASPISGSFKVVANIVTEDSGKTQTNAIPMILKVFAC